ncbi:MAG: metalloregulator ArsR/SmtB family transcription factor [Candidatus Micrarchaeia archaeon]|jgi:ArsR family transcriptional regulator
MHDLVILKALADRTRLSIVRTLLKGEMCACELPKLVGRAQPTVSLQLKKLVRAGILACRKDGTKMLYRVVNPKVAVILRNLN